MVFEKISALLAEKMDCDLGDIKPETQFSELGIDSLDVTELVMNLEDDLGIEIELDASVKTVADLVAVIEAKL